MKPSQHCGLLGSVQRSPHRTYQQAISQGNLHRVQRALKSFSRFAARMAASTVPRTQSHKETCIVCAGLQSLFSTPFRICLSYLSQYICACACIPYVKSEYIVTFIFLYFSLFLWASECACVRVCVCVRARAWNILALVFSYIFFVFVRKWVSKWGIVHVCVRGIYWHLYFHIFCCCCEWGIEWVSEWVSARACVRACTHTNEKI